MTIPTVYCILNRKTKTVRTKSKDRRFDGALAKLLNADLPGHGSVRTGMAENLGISPLRPARVVVLEVLQGGLGRPEPIAGPVGAA